MVDFKKKLKAGVKSKSTNPTAIYERLDRKSDKGPLRPAQEAILREWHESRRDDKDVIIKLHTGQGKTLIGLLILQSKLNLDQRPALYICPNKFLAEQTVEQAAAFGINCVIANDELPTEFIDGDAILVTHVQKVFNGLSKFGIGTNSIDIGSIVIDDAHACIESIRQAGIIDLDNEHDAYAEVLSYFEDELKHQGMGTFADIRAGEYGQFLPVPYWAWSEHVEDVIRILAPHARGDNRVKFAWPLIKDNLEQCICLIAGHRLQIVPYQPPLHKFGFFIRAQHRVYMSATMADDSVLITSLGIAPATVQSPLHYNKEKWSGERMVLIPSEIDQRLDSSMIGEILAKPKGKRKFGVVVIVPSRKAAEMWRSYGATVVDSNSIDDEIGKMRVGDLSAIRVLVNRYDGVDLPDDSCRTLILDGKPHADDLLSRYEESVRVDSELVGRRIARTIEQGMGRSVRGEKDYSVVILSGAELVRLIRSKSTRLYFSPQTRMQIEIGLAVADMAQEDIGSGITASEVLMNLMDKCLKRDDDWKEYYSAEMNAADYEIAKSKMLVIYEAEREAEEQFRVGNYEKARRRLQKMLDDMSLPAADHGWYLQQMARMIYRSDKTVSNDLQLAAFQKNTFLLKPRHGITYRKLKAIPERRASKIIEWTKKYGEPAELMLAVNDIADNIRFGQESDIVEAAFGDLGRALGFETQRPDREWKEGPDNLWAMDDKNYLLLEVKSETKETRAAISKSETGQMNNSVAWFHKNYKGCKSANLIMIPTKVLDKGAIFNDYVRVMTKDGYEKLLKNFKGFYVALTRLSFDNLSIQAVSDRLDEYHLAVAELSELYSKEPITKKTH